MDRNGRVFLRVAVAGYLVYLAWQIVTTQLAGGSSMSDLFAYCAAAVMALAGLAFAVYALLAYWKEKQNDGESASGPEEDVHDQTEE